MNQALIDTKSILEKRFLEVKREAEALRRESEQILIAIEAIKEVGRPEETAKKLAQNLPNPNVVVPKRRRRKRTSPEKMDKKVLSMFHGDKIIRAADLTKDLNLSNTSTIRSLTRLQKAGELKRLGSGPNGSTLWQRVDTSSIEGEADVESGTTIHVPADANAVTIH